MAKPNPSILDAFRDRLLAAINRSSLMKVSITKTGSLLDLRRLEILKPGLAHDVLQTLIGDRPVNIDFSWRFATPQVTEVADQESDDGPTVHSQKLIEAVFTRIVRKSLLAKRELGIQAVWLGFPLLHIMIGDDKSKKQLLAPVFLWPVAIQPDERREGRYRLCRDGLPRFNRAMAVWTKNNLKVVLDEPTEEEVAALTWEKLPLHLARLAEALDLTVPSPVEQIKAVPSLKSLQDKANRNLFASAVLGFFRWQNERLLADVESIKDFAECTGPIESYVSGDSKRPSPPITLVPSVEDQYLVDDADFSQERTVWSVRNAQGTVIHGPPGTGKSQTIVNIIADALAHDRTVLMVCQKQAATRVVLERLRGVGLEKLCIEVHDAESERNSVFKQIRDQAGLLPAEMTRSKTHEKRMQLAREVTELKAYLDGIAKGFHEKHQDIQLSFQQIKAREGRIQRLFPAARPLQSLNADLRNVPAGVLKQICQHAENVGIWFCESDPANNPWRHHQPTLHDDPGTKEDLHLLIERLLEHDEQHQAQCQRRGVGHSLPPDTTGLESAVRDVVEVLKKYKSSTRAVFLRAWLSDFRKNKPDAHQLRVVHHKVAEAVSESARVAKLPLDPDLAARCESIGDSELMVIRRQAERVVRLQHGWWWQRLFGGYSSASRVLSRWWPREDNASIETIAVRIVETLTNYERHMNLAQMNKTLVPKLKPRKLGVGEHQFKYSRDAKESLKDAVWLREQEQKFPILNGIIDCIQKGTDFTAAEKLLQCTAERATIVSTILEDLRRLEAYLKTEGLEEPRAKVLAGRPIRDWLLQLKHGFRSFPSLLRWEADCRQRTQLGHSVFRALEQYERDRRSQKNLPVPPDYLINAGYGQWWSALIELTAVRAWLSVCYERSPNLINFDPHQHEKKRQRLRDALHEKRELEPIVIRERWVEKQIRHRSEPWNKMFQLSGANSKRIRQAVELSLPRGLLNLRPCWLVDPETAAHIFPLQQGIFDVVIFDEASQCPLEYAIPAIFRGTTLVVSGDAKQLPPTGFFSSKIKADDSEEDDDDAEATDEVVSETDKKTREINAAFLRSAEDLLEASIGNLPGDERLLVHYRSDHPALIEFSNRAFYQGMLEAPPARMDQSKIKVPIEYREVGGKYENRTNRAEGHEIVELLKEMWLSEGAAPTIGVVTFNRPQSDLISDLLDEQCRKDQAFGARFQQEVARKDQNQDVGFFVKNLENVQGDERDIMIFSTTFGRSNSGAFYRKFGPVGAERGERRLNVAVTRAKKKVVIVGSMPIEEISDAMSLLSTPGSALRPRCYLQLYLAYSKAVSDMNEERVQQILDRLMRRGQSSQPIGGLPDSPFEEEVRQCLLNLGHTVDCQVGESGFKIDLAVRHPDPSRGYVIGIECDGATYHSERSAHLRDVWRETILRRRGWTIHRIWSTNWWYRRNEEVAKLQDVIKSALVQAGMSTAVMNGPNAPETAKSGFGEP
jgi:primosomal replication protein N''